jgi:hypothetical protein
VTRTRASSKSFVSFSLALALVAVLLAPEAPAAVTTLAPVADAYVTSAKPTANFGARARLDVRQGKVIERSYVRFDVSGTSGSVSSATLQLYATASDQCGVAAGVVVHRAASAAWSERTITYRNQPGFAGGAVAAADAFGPGYVSLDVTSAVTAGASSAEFVLEMPSCGTAVNRFASRETPQAPRLSLTTADTAAPEVAITQPAQDGATVESRVDVAGSASDDISVAAVEISLDGGGWTTAACTGCGSPTATWSHELTGLSPGSHSLEARARDSSGNLSEVATRSFSAQDAPSPPPGCDGVHLFPGDNLVERINGTTGTTFCVHAGTYDLGNASIHPGTGDRLIGDPVTVVGDGEISAPTKIVSRSVNGVIDFVGQASGVVLENLDLSGAAGDDACKPACGRGVNGHGGNASNLTVRYSRIHHNANQGIGGVNGSLLAHVELDSNGGAAFVGCCAAGVKSIHPYTIRESYIHHNHGNGVWQDVCGTDLVVVHNVIKSNHLSGVRYEHNQSCPGNATIQHNLIQNNNSSTKANDAGGIAINSAPNADVGFNTFGGNFGAAVYVGGSRGPHTGTYIHDNALNGDLLVGCHLADVTCERNA